MVYLDDSMTIRMSKLRLKKLLIGGIIFVIVIIYLFSSHFNNTELQFHTSFNVFTDKITNWLEGQVLGISYEERFCKHVTKWNSSSEYPPVKIVAKQLNIADGDKVFINGLHCGEWLVALKGTFPNIKLFGVDKDPDSIAYVSALVNGTYKVAQPFDIVNADFKDTMKFDHAIIDGILSIYSQNLQCKAVMQMIPMLKAGGSMYIGKNFEQCDQNREVELHLQNYLHIKVLPLCYWSNKCLHGRQDVVEILYSQENIMLSDNVQVTEYSALDKKKKELLVDFSSCATSIFIHKHIVISNNDNNRLLPESKYVGEKHNHQCTHSETVNSTKNGKLMDGEGIKKAVSDMKIRGLDMH